MDRLREAAGRAGMLVVYTGAFLVACGLLAALLALEFIEFGAFVLRGCRDGKS